MRRSGPPVPRLSFGGPAAGSTDRLPRPGGSVRATGRYPSRSACAGVDARRLRSGSTNPCPRRRGTTRALRSLWGRAERDPPRPTADNVEARSATDIEVVATCFDCKASSALFRFLRLRKPSLLLLGPCLAATAAVLFGSRAISETSSELMSMNSRRRGRLFLFPTHPQGLSAASSPPLNPNPGSGRRRRRRPRGLLAARSAAARRVPAPPRPWSTSNRRRRGRRRSRRGGRGRR